MYLNGLLVLLAGTESET